VQSVGKDLGEAIETLRFPLREGKIRSRYWGTDRVIEPLAWYRATIFSDGTVAFHTGDALYEGRLKAIGLGRIGDRVEVHRDDMLRCFPEQGQKRQRDPEPGTVDRYCEAVKEIMRVDKTLAEVSGPESSVLAPHPPPPNRFENAIMANLGEFGRVGKSGQLALTIPWKTFCTRVRETCGIRGDPPRGFKDRTIQNGAKKIWRDHKVTSDK
jgi:hypothetical protein